MAIVHDVSNDSLDDFLKEHHLVLLVFYHPLAPRWQRFSPVFEKTADSCQNLSVAFAKLDCAGNRYITRRYPIQTYPTVMLFRSHDDFHIYNGPLREKDIVAYLTRQSSPTTTTVKAETLSDFKTASEVVIVGYFDSLDSLPQKKFYSIAEAMHEDFLFGVTDDAALARTEEIEVPSIVVYKSFDEPKVVLRWTDDESATAAILKERCQPLFVEFLPELHDGWMKADVFLAYLFISTTAQHTAVLSSIRSVASEHKGRIQFGIVDTNIFDDLVEDVHLDTEDTPAFAIRDPKKNLSYPMNETDSSPFSGQVSAFVSKFFAGAIDPTIKSAPLPDQSDGSIVEVVALNYEAVVLDPNKDVLIEYYTPWCGPCKVLLPMYERLAAMYASDARSRKRVTIAKMDVEANDVPGDNDIRGFPTFKLFAADRKHEPAVYDGPRTLAGWRDFIKSEGTHEVELEPQSS